MLALVAAVCFASAVAGATAAPSAVRGLSSLAADAAPAPAAPVSSGTIILTDPVATESDENLCAFDKYLEVWECPRTYTEDGKAAACKEGEYCKESHGDVHCFFGSNVHEMGGEADKAGCSREELAAAQAKIDDLFADHPYGANNNICYEKKKELGTCTKIEIIGICGETTEVIRGSMSC